MQMSSPTPEAEQLSATMQAEGQLARKVSGSTLGQAEH